MSDTAPIPATATAKEPADKNKGALRQYSGPFSVIITVLCLLWVAFQLWFTTFGRLEAVSFRAAHALWLLVFCFILHPVRKKENRARRRPPALDIALIAACLFVFGYFIIYYPAISRAGGFTTAFQTGVAAAGIVLVFIAARRAAGGLVWLAALFLAYAFLGRFIPGTLGHGGFTLSRVANHLFWGSQGLFGAGVGVSATYIFTFVLFGAFLNKSGFTGFITDIALTLAGAGAGGTAKVAVVTAGLMGMMNGSAPAIVATTGSFTLPMMRRSGYSREYAGAVVAAAATGGQFCPPVMGAVAFLMAEFAGVSYGVVALAAALPAFLYYFGMLWAVHLQARRAGLGGISRQNLPAVKTVLRRRGHLAAPLVSLVVLMALGFTALFACIASTLVCVAAAAARKHTRMGWRAIAAACEDGAKSAVGVGVCCLVIGVVVGVVSLTGLGLKFGFLMLRVVGPGQLLLCGLMVAVMATVLGMGVPGIAAYVIVTAVAVPVMLQVGCAPVPAHLFCLMYASLSNITPPVAISAYVAAGMAGGRQAKTGWLAMRVGLAGFLLPFYFLLNPVLLLGQAPAGTPFWHILLAAAGAAAGVILLAAGTEGWFFGRCAWWQRVLLVGASLLLIAPSLPTDLAGLALAAAAGLPRLARDRTLKNSNNNKE